MKRSRTKSKTSVTVKTKTKAATKPQKRALEKVEDVKKLMHLLELNQIELEHQNQELRITEEELEASRNKYLNLFDFSPIPYFVLDRGGVIKEVNLCASTMIGVDRNKLIGQRFVTHVQQSERDIFDEFMKTVFASSAKESCKLTIVNKDKLASHVLLEGAKVDDKPESAQECQIALIDLTDHMKAEDERV